MPNHVYQTLKIKNGFEEVEKLVGKEFDIDTFFKMPEELRDISSPVKIVSDDEFEQEKIRYEKSDKNSIFTIGMSISQKYSDELIEKYGSNNWYDWACNNWGTKWGVYDVSLCENDTYMFQSAWSPATKIVQKLSEKFPNATFILKFADEGGGFIGYEHIKNGEIIKSKDFEWSSSSASKLRKEVGC